jgi:regulator of protease activity HflC (stomatin/prohibitin superfamily)
MTVPAAGPWEQAIRLAFGFLFAAVAVLTAAWVGSNIRVVPPDARAAVLRLGAVTRIEGPGLLLAWPRPIEQVVLLPGADRQIEHRVRRFESTPVALPGQPPEFQVSPDIRSNATFLLTGESGIVHLQATLFYRIDDPRAYLLAAAHVPAALDRIFGASAVAVCATRSLDAILVARPGAGDAGGASRESFRADLVRETNRRLDALAAQGVAQGTGSGAGLGVGLGVRISRVDIAASLPGGAKAAFDRVLLATQTADATIARARTEATRIATAAREQRLRILADAEARAAEQRVEISATASLMDGLAARMQGVDAPAQRRALFDARAGTVLRRAREVATVNPDDGARLLLPGPGAVAPGPGSQTGAGPEGAGPGLEPHER